MDKNAIMLDTLMECRDALVMLSLIDKSSLSKDLLKKVEKVLGEVELPVVEKPILIGHLNTLFGYNGHNPIEVGNPVYLFKDRYHFEMTPINGGKPVIVKFYKETLEPCIDFIDSKTNLQ